MRDAVVRGELRLRISHAVQIVFNPRMSFASLSDDFDLATKAQRKRFNAFEGFEDVVRGEFEYFKKNFQPVILGEPWFESIDIGKEFAQHRQAANAGAPLKFPSGSSLRVLQIQYGRIPARITEFENTGNAKQVVESGGSLVFSQSPDGYIAIFVYPRVSEYFSRVEKHVIYEYNIDPTRYSKKTITKAFSFFASYCLASSVFGRKQLLFDVWYWWISRIACLAPNDIGEVGLALGKILFKLIK
ncbi:hypothetical protein DA2_0661 [Desulfovibrio sp. A2]|nr:hypothetical protein DA2_0661 [Desulfovibrio sp. A2]